MKKSEKQAGNKPEKTTKSPKSGVLPKKVIKTKPDPTEEAVREKAAEIYFQRIERGEPGSAVNDWLEAEAFLKDSAG